MNSQKHKNFISGLIIVIFALFIFHPTANYADTITADTSRSTEKLGDFIGEFTYRLFSPTAAELDVTLRNVSPSSSGGFLTGFVFNNPNNFITGVSLSSLNPFFSLLGGPSFQDSISASPLGQYDIGAALGGNFLGGGNTTKGIPVGGTASFGFALTGNNLNQLNTSSFIQPKSAEGDFLVARFKGFNDGGSDKVPGVTAVPEPDIIFLLGIGLIGIVIFNKRESKARSKEFSKK